MRRRTVVPVQLWWLCLLARSRPTALILTRDAVSAVGSELRMILESFRIISMIRWIHEHN